MKISIITVTLDNKAGLLRAIESVRSQTYKNVEHIIVDGGSTDGTAEAINNYQLTINNDKVDELSRSQQNQENGTKISLPTSRDRNDSNDDKSSRIPNGMRDLKDSERFITPAGIRNDKSLITNHYTLVSISEKDNGIYDAINKGIKLATGDVIGLLHSDDFYADEFVLEKYAEAFSHRAKRQAQSVRNKGGTPIDSPDRSEQAAQGDEVEAVYSDLVYVREKSKNEHIDNLAFKIENSVIRTWKTHPSHFDYAQCDTLRMTKWIKNGWMPPHPTLFVRREVFENYGLYRTDMKIAADYEMILRLFYKYKITSHYLPITTYCMTIGGASNKSLRNIFIKSSEDYRAMKMQGIAFPMKTLFMKNVRKLPQFFRKS
jgi:glycosyltransferase